MPGRDGTGPYGTGPVGRRLGPCGGLGMVRRSRMIRRSAWPIAGVDGSGALSRAGAGERWFPMRKNSS